MTAVDRAVSRREITDALLKAMERRHEVLDVLGPPQRAHDPQNAVDGVGRTPVRGRQGGGQGVEGPEDVIEGIEDVESGHGPALPPQKDGSSPGTLFGRGRIGAQSRGRTGTPSQERVFETRASANSAIWAGLRHHTQWKARASTGVPAFSPEAGAKRRVPGSRRVSAALSRPAGGRPSR